VTTIQRLNAQLDRERRRKQILQALADAARRDALRATGTRADALREHARELEFQAACLDPT
jgi:hypothetical protein